MRAHIERPEKTWERFWQQYNWKEFPKWDYMSELVLFLLVREFHRCAGRLCLEGGSGSGNISLELAKRGAETVLLDSSKTVIECSRDAARGRKADPDFIVGSILKLPFRASSLDFVWSAGVLEHFRFGEQQAAISESLRILKSGRKLVVIVPNRKAYFYNLFRILSIGMKTWPFGYEEPLSSKEFERFSPQPTESFSCGLLLQLIFCAYVHPFFRTLTFALEKLLGVSLIAKIDKNLPGYILAVIFHK